MTPAEESICFYYELGLAMTQWSHVENDLCTLALSFCHDGDRNAMALGFFSIENFRSKLAFTNAIVEKKLSEQSSAHAQEWDGLRKRVSDVSANRNRLAHRTVRIYPQNGEARRYALIPWIRMKPKTNKERNKPPPGSLFVRDINRIRLEFFALVCTLSNFRDRVHGRTVTFPKATEIPKDPMTNTEIVNFVRVAFGNPKLSAKEKRKLVDAENAKASLEQGNGS